MTQSKRSSFIEAFLNVAIGYVLAICTQLVVFPLFGMQITFKENLMVGTVFLVVSLVRSYVLRRIFNWIHR